MGRDKFRSLDADWMEIKRIPAKYKDVFNKSKSWRKKEENRLGLDLSSRRKEIDRLKNLIDDLESQDKQLTKQLQTPGRSKSELAILAAEKHPIIQSRSDSVKYKKDLENRCIELYNTGSLLHSINQGIWKSPDDVDTDLIKPRIDMVTIFKDISFSDHVLPDHIIDDLVKSGVKIPGHTPSITDDSDESTGDNIDPFA